MTKKPIIRSFICAAIICVLPACQTTTKKPKTIHAGMPVSELIENYGKPVSVSADRDLNYYVWDLSSARLDSSSSKRSTTMSGAGSISRSSSAMPKIIKIYCRLSVTTNIQQQVQDWQATGEGCRQILLDHI